MKLDSDQLKLKANQRVTIFTLATFIISSLGAPLSFSKPRPPTIWTPSKPRQAALIKDLDAKATITLQKHIEFQASQPVSFQNGNLTDEIEFFGTPRCYLHTRSSNDSNTVSGTKVSAEAGRSMQITKIDNIYQKGTVHVTFWFDQDSMFSDLACVTNFNHTLTVNELKDAVGHYFSVNLPEKVQKAALVNTAPNINAPTLSEDTPADFPIRSKRTILSNT